MRDRLVTGARLLSVPINQTPACNAGPSVYPGPRFYPTFYGSTETNNHLIL